jgi:hypothetical protein
MINTDMRIYSYYTFGEPNAYKQPQLSTEPQGTIKISINTTSQAIQDNIKYKDCAYIGLTHNKDINDKWVIDYNGEKLKVLYVNSKGKFTQVFLNNI